MTQTASLIDPETAAALAEGQHGDPFSVLGLHKMGGKLVIRAIRPEAEDIDVLDAKTGRKLVSLGAIHDAPGVFAAIVPRRKKPFVYRLRLTRGSDTW